VLAQGEGCLGEAAETQIGVDVREEALGTDVAEAEVLELGGERKFCF